MKYRILGNSGLKISEVSFGCMSLKPENPDVSNLVSKAIDSGITLFDTADLYDKGQNEILLGKAIAGHRNDIFISSKVGNQWRNDGSGWDWNPTKKHILSAIDATLERLGTDHLDLYLLHGGTIEDPIDETIEAFEMLKESGKICAYGISSIRPNVIREWVDRSHLSAVMTQYSFLDRRPEEEILPLLHQNKIGILTRGTIAGGLLADKPAAPYLGFSADEVSERTEFIKEKSGNAASSSTAVRFAIDHPGVTSAVIGIRTTTQLSEAITASEQNPDDEKRRELSEGFVPNQYAEHR